MSYVSGRLVALRPTLLLLQVGFVRMRALSSAWTECLASDQVVAGSNPAAPIILRDG